MHRKARAIISFVFFIAPFVAAETKLNYAPPPPDNPLMGLVPYVDSDAVDRFPHSLEFRYFALSDLMTGPNQFDWSPLEKTLETTKHRGCQLVTRIFLEYPGKQGIPVFLTEAGLKVTRWESADGHNVTPDYEDERLRAALKNFISAFANRYDRDPRLGFLTAGILGSWGEWHTYPRSELFASREVQSEVLDALASHFQHLPVLLRYPAGANHYAYVKNTHLPFGYHDDSFAWATLKTGRPEDDWFFIPLLEKAGALDKWKTHPIGGEIRPELWHTSFTGKTIPGAQDFSACVQQTHTTWLMDSGLFEKRFSLSDARKQRALTEVAKMGYAYHVHHWQITENQIEIVVENRGVAPFYRSWNAQLFLFSENQKPQKVTSSFPLAGILPGESRVWRATIPDIQSRTELRLIAPNPMDGGKPLRFANQTQGAEWLILGAVEPTQP